MQRPVTVIWTGKNRCGLVEIYGWGGRVKKLRSKNRSSKTIDIVSYASKVSVNGITCVLVVHFRSSDTFKVCKLAQQLTFTFLVSTKTCVTGNNVVLHKAVEGAKQNCHNVGGKRLIQCYYASE